MTAFLNVLRITILIFPEVIGLVLAIEKTIDVPKVGAHRLELLRGIVTDAWNTLEARERGELKLEQLLQAAAGMANRLVAFFKAVGIFKGSSA